MISVCSRPWFAIYVKPRHEKNVAAALNRKGYEIFLPLYWRRAKCNKAFELPLFPGYVFCRVDQFNTVPIMTTAGVFSIVGNGRVPQPIPESEIEVVRRMVESGLMPVPWPYVSAGQEICLRSGPLRSVRGVVVDASNGKWLVISIDLLRRSVAVKVDRESLQAGSILVIAPRGAARARAGNG